MPAPGSSTMRVGLLACRPIDLYLGNSVFDLDPVIFPRQNRFPDSDPRFDDLTGLITE